MWTYSYTGSDIGGSQSNEEVTGHFLFTSVQPQSEREREKERERERESNPSHRQENRRQQ